MDLCLTLRGKILEGWKNKMKLFILLCGMFSGSMLTVCYKYTEKPLCTIKQIVPQPLSLPVVHYTQWQIDSYNKCVGLAKHDTVIFCSKGD